MKQSFGEILKDLRLEKGIGQVELAKSINVSKGIISLWENGLREPKLSNLVALAKFFKVSIDYLAGFDNFF
ncbi:MAG: helix-turn-helix transcriptional regulator [Clostridia bacterium]|nr:helix-turn-helix transcriptional regulator [Clostridia bacterium]